MEDALAAEMPDKGKVSPEIFDEVILPRLGRRRDDVVVGPQHGVDVGVIDIGGGRVMAMTTDPVFIVPQYGWRRSAWFAVHISSHRDAVDLRPRADSHDGRPQPAALDDSRQLRGHVAAVRRRVRPRSASR